MKVLRIGAWSALVSILLLSVPIPLGYKQIDKLGVAFPCQDRPCGCSSAEQCWTSCGCFTTVEKIAWAKKNRVKIPSYAVLDTPEELAKTSAPVYRQEPLSKSCESCAGVSAGIDGALYLVARLRGFEAARRVATGIEFDYWSGFKSQAAAIPRPDANGLIAQTGLVHEDSESCAYMQLMKIVNREGFESALKKYPDLLASKHGEMVSEASLDESAGWLQKHSRDPEVAISAFRFIAAVHPQSSKAHLRLGEALLAQGRKKQAKVSLERAIELDSNNESAKTARQACED